MADYETYDPVGWSDGTPITSTRLQQMSSNTDMVKDVTIDYSQGIIAKRQHANASIGNVTGQGPVQLELISLIDLGGGSDYRVSAAENRYIKITFSTPGIEIQNGSENERYLFTLRYSDTGFSGTTGTLLQEWYFGIPGQDVLTNNAVTISSSSVLLATSLVAMTTAKRVGGGTYSFIQESPATAMVSRSYGIWIERTGSGTQSSFNMVNSSGQHQLFAEDCGKIVGA